MHSSPSYTLPRLIRAGGRLFSSLQQALHLGANPLTMEVEDGSGGWRPYHVNPATPSSQRRLPPCLCKFLCDAP